MDVVMAPCPASSGTQPGDRHESFPVAGQLAVPADLAGIRQSHDVRVLLVMIDADMYHAFGLLRFRE